MKFSSKQYYRGERGDVAANYRRRQVYNNNILQINFEDLKDNSQMLIGDPYFCEKCKSVLNSLSVLKKDEIDENIKHWNCEFCGHENLIQIEDGEITNKDDVIYMLQTAMQKKSQQDQSDVTIIYCIDNSGSMSATEKAPQDIQMKRPSVSNDELESLKEFMEPWEFNQYKKQVLQAQEFITRQNCVLAAIENQIQEEHKEHPQRKIGIIYFNDEVTIVGDGSELPLTIAGDQLNDEQICQTEGANAFESHLKLTIQESHQHIFDKLDDFKEKGRTALGPALYAAIGMASKGQPGSMVIICTDGLANIGIGSLDTNNPEEEEKAKKYYDEITTLAKANGISISVVTIKGEECKILILGEISDETGGKIIRVNPEEITKQFQNVMKNQIIATGVSVEMRIHKGFTFINEEDENIDGSEYGSFLKQDIGNVHQKKKISIEYLEKKEEELIKLGLEFKEGMKLPCQAKIFFTSVEGHKMMRVITQQQILTENQKNVDYSYQVMEHHTRLTTTKMALKGKTEFASLRNRQFQDFMKDEIDDQRNQKEKKQSLHSLVETSNRRQNLIEQREMIVIKKSLKEPEEKQSESPLLIKKDQELEKFKSTIKEVDQMNQSTVKPGQLIKITNNKPSEIKPLEKQQLQEHLEEDDCAMDLYDGMND